METAAIVKALGALAQKTRLEVFRRLIVAGSSGLPAGALATLTGTPGPTLTFHLKELGAARLIERRRVGRSILYRANYAHMCALVDFLAEDCCKGDPELARSQAAQCGFPAPAAGFREPKTIRKRARA